MEADEELKNRLKRKNIGYAVVKQFGKTKIREIDRDKNDASQEQLKTLFNKNKTDDILRDIGQILSKMTNKEDDGQEKIQTKDNPASYLRKKYIQTSTMTILNNIKMLINLKAICGVLYVKSLIKRVELSKRLFIHEME